MAQCLVKDKVFTFVEFSFECHENTKSTGTTLPLQNSVLNVMTTQNGNKTGELMTLLVFGVACNFIRTRKDMDVVHYKILQQY
jgi:hypothetical protein